MHYDYLALFSQWLYSYGPPALFFLLALGIIGLPVPEDILMILSGVLIAKGKLLLIPTLLAAYAGSICGITVSYLLGFTAGHYLVEKYGYRIGITQDRLQRVHNWFDRIGKWTLFFGYFFPAIRHFTGYVAGTTQLNRFSFMLFAYTGAMVWSSIFISIGYFFGTQWNTIVENINKYLAITFVVALLIAGVYFLIRHHRKK